LRPTQRRCLCARLERLAKYRETPPALSSLCSRFLPVFFPQAEAQMEKGAWKDLVSPVDFMLYRTMLGFGVQLLQQFSGINAVGYPL